MKDKNLKIALGDLRHQTVGKHSSFMPINIGYIASYALSQIDDPESIEIRFYTNPNIISKDIKEWQPDVIGLTNYCWNTELSQTMFKYAKKINQQVICIAGGPNFPTDHKKCEKYLLEKPEIDFYVYFEGEVAFAKLIKKLEQEAKISQLKSEPQDGIMSIHPETKTLVFGTLAPRIANLDEIPSPYLNGLMDQWFDGSYAPSIEIARGCPFSCGYCFVGSQQYYSQVTTFSVERIKQELTYIAQKMSKYPNILLSICDSDFGMYEHDEQIAHHIRKLQDKFNWPNLFNVTTGKANYERILRIAALLKNRMDITCSVQSLNPKTLEVIKRKNPSMKEYQKINTEIKKHGIRATTEIIAPMPEETKSSFFKGLKSISNIIGIDRIVPYTLMLLQGTYLESEKYRKKYQFKTKFRILPRQFGEYMGKKCFEIEEICIATKTMPFNDYLDIRGFSLISAFFMDNQFDVIHRHLKELDTTNYNYLYYLWKLIKSNKTVLSEIYNQFIEENKKELWDSPKAIYDYFTKQENYDKLVNGKLGDNLIRKYKTRILLEKCIPAINLAYSTLEKMTAPLITKEIHQSLLVAKQWTITLRNVGAVFKDKPHININETINLSYDVQKWYLDGPNSKPLIDYKKPVNYQIFCDTKKLKMIFAEAKKVFGGDFFFQISKILVNRNIKDFWYQAKTKKQL